VAELFNAIVESLRQLVTQVKTAAAQVNVSVGENAGAITQLSVEAFKQAEEMRYTLDSVEQMMLSIQAVADSARTAAVVARTASTTAEAGGAAMERTVQSILDLRLTVAETALKVKHLGESSQQISQVVFLINQIAMQTNLIEIKASIEAARGGTGQEFAVLAEEVGQLSAQSAAASKEIEQIVANIQRETLEVVSAMELGTTQVIAGSELVADTQKSLGQIVNVSRQVDQLVQSISTATVSQAQISEVVTNLIKQVANGSERTSDSYSQVSSSLQQTVEVAQQFQASVSAFKVGSET
jgi:methyl-accepting chemotaxis protein